MKKNILKGFLGFGLSLILSTPAWAVDVYQIDPTHSSIAFAVKHLMVGTTRGEFNHYSGAIELDKGDLPNSKANVEIKAASLDTRLADRDNHLRGPDFFDVEKYPLITFTSKQIRQAGGNYIIIGDLTMKGVTKEVSIPVTISDPVKSPFGSMAIGISGETILNRQQYGITWNKQMDNGGLVVGDDVKVIVNLEAHKK